MAVELKRSRFAKRFKTRGLGAISRQWPALRIILGLLTNLIFRSSKFNRNLVLRPKVALGLQSQAHVVNGILEFFWSGAEVLAVLWFFVSMPFSRILPGPFYTPHFWFWCFCLQLLFSGLRLGRFRVWWPHSTVFSSVFVWFCFFCGPHSNPFPFFLLFSFCFFWVGGLLWGCTRDIPAETKQHNQKPLKRLVFFFFGGDAFATGKTDWDRKKPKNKKVNKQRRNTPDTNNL